MVFYPKAIADFCRQHPLGLSRENQVSLQPAGLHPVPPKPPVVLSVTWLGLIWLIWLGGAIAFPLLAVSWGWSWLELLLFVGAYSCIIAAVYIYVLGRRHKLLFQYKQQMSEYREQLIKYQEQQSFSDSQPQPKLLSPNPQLRCQMLADVESSLSYRSF